MLLMIATSLLLAAAPEAPAKIASVAEKPEDRKICRRQVETGSLVKGKKVCMTAQQWKLVGDNSREEVERSVSMGSRSGQ